MDKVILQLKEAIVSLNHKFDSFSNVIDHKITDMHKDYKTLESKLETI